MTDNARGTGRVFFPRRFIDENRRPFDVNVFESHVPPTHAVARSHSTRVSYTNKIAGASSSSSSVRREWLLICFFFRCFSPASRESGINYYYYYYFRRARQTPYLPRAIITRRSCSVEINLFLNQSGPPLRAPSTGRRLRRRPLRTYTPEESDDDRITTVTRESRRKRFQLKIH